MTKSPISAAAAVAAVAAVAAKENTMTKAHPVEKDVKRDARKLLTERGWFSFMPAANTYGISGVSDTLAIRKGVFLAVEIKLKKEDGSGPQETFMRNVREAGGLTFLCNQRTLDDGSFAAFLNKAGLLGDKTEELQRALLSKA